MAEPDFAGAFEKMLEARSPTGVTHGGWLFFFPHSEDELAAVRSVLVRSGDYSLSSFKDELARRKRASKG